MTLRELGPSAPAKSRFSAVDINPEAIDEGAARELFGLGDARDAAGDASRNISAANAASLYSMKACGRWCNSRNAVSPTKTVNSGSLIVST